MFTDETAACMLVGEHAFVMLLSREKLAELSNLPIADPTTHTLALYCFSVSSRDEVDTISAAALTAPHPVTLSPIVCQITTRTRLGESARRTPRTTSEAASVPTPEGNPEQWRATADQRRR
jgi:hypothetical protein